MSVARIDGIELYYETSAGETCFGSPPLLLIAGLASDSQSWGPVVGDLARGRRLILPDNREVGRTQPWRGVLDVTDLADDCAALARHLGFEHIDVLGHSLGGFAAQTLALRCPGLVRRLVLVASAGAPSARNRALFRDWAATLDPGGPTATWWRGLFYWIFSRRFFADPAQVQAALDYAIRYPYPQPAAAFRAQVEAIAGFDGRAGLSHIAAPTQVLAGGQDLLFPPDACAAVAAAIPGARLEIIAAAPHAVHTECPREFCEAVVGFLGAP
jgi:pimeloyl-ACP methyl ester carboxylesterase